MLRISRHTSSTLILNSSAPQGCVLSPLLYSLFTYDCAAIHSFNIIFKFADDTTILGLITDNNETAYREEVKALTSWCQSNNLSLNVSKTKEMFVDYRRQQGDGHSPIHIGDVEVEKVCSFKFLGMHITEDFSWSLHTDTVAKKARQ